jgi:hypothetical protein
MPSWVVPAVAAELWAVPLEQVMADAAAGRIPSRTDGGLLFVDIDPVPQASQPEAQPPHYRRSLAWAMGGASSQPIVTAEERNALLDNSDEKEDVQTTEAEDEGVPVDDPPPPTPLTSEDVPNWNEVRSRVSRTRRPPDAAREAA